MAVPGGGFLVEKLRFGPQSDRGHEPGGGLDWVIAQPQIEGADQQVLLPPPHRRPRIQFLRSVPAQRHQGALERGEQIFVVLAQGAARRMVDGPVPVGCDLPMLKVGQLVGQIAVQPVYGDGQSVVCQAGVLSRRNTDPPGVILDIVLVGVVIAAVEVYTSQRRGELRHRLPHLLRQARSLVG